MGNNMVGFRFRPTDEELVEHYLRPKNNGGGSTTSSQVINTVNICNLDPWELPPLSRMASSDQVWYFFGRKESRYNRGERQKRKTKSGFWKKTGKTLPITRKSGNHETIGEKRVLIFYTNGSRSNWVMHEYRASCLSPNDSGAYTICKVQFKGEASEISSSSGVDHVVHTHSLPTPMNNPVGSEVGQSLFHFFLTIFFIRTHLCCFRDYRVQVSLVVISKKCSLMLKLRWISKIC
ncbi:NAC domain-containing protein 5-like isoform X1 [Brassica rapa]|uniref:NAC domain-containing protein 5-like isoform X1 n=1 Tax=Brassica campestris TaxID=3711 RepID=UPI00142DB686|nr:NAC domain-containing protein 5-like isoform X1 [Brassica rapa]